MKFNKITILLIICAFSVLFSCSKDNSPTDTNTDPGTDTAYANVTWTANTIKFEANDVIESDSSYNNVSFSSENTKAKNLQVGDILFIYGKALKKVYSVTENSGNITVETEDCTLNEAISNGEIVWNKNLRWTEDLIQGVKIDSKYPTIQKILGNTVEFSFPVGNGMTGKIKMILNQERLDATCEITKEVGVAKIRYAFEGFVQKIRSEGKIKYENQELKEFKYVNSNIEGEVTVSLTATGSSSDLLGGIELPLVLIKVPLLIGGIPCVFNVKMLFVINTEMASIDASAHIKTKFKFNSTTGVKYDGTDVGIVGSAGPYNMDFVKDSCWVGSSVAAGINFGLTFPRFELGIFGNIVVPYVHTAFLIGGSFTAGTKPCLKADASFIGAAGYNFNFFGLLKFNGKKNLWQLDQNIKKIGQCD
ncbi:MAG: hypothetical protein WCT77_08425 [Bacteroidota bacterium]